MCRTLVGSLGALCIALAGCEHASPTVPARVGAPAAAACRCDTNSANISVAASAFATAHQRVAQPAAVIAGIDGALRVCEVNLTHAEQIAFRATRADVGSDGELHLCVDITQGALNDTRRDLDLGIQGDGYFKVKVRDRAGDGFAYSRNGNFFLNNKGELVVGLGDGYRVEPAIMLPSDATEVTIGQSGVIEYKLPGSPHAKEAGQLLLYRFRHAERLSALKDGLYLENEESGPPMECRPGTNDAGIVLQGFLEASNVNVERERLRTEFLRRWRDSIREAVLATTVPSR